MTAERVLILYQGTKPGIGELQQLIETVSRKTDRDLGWTKLDTYQQADPTERGALFLVARLADEKALTPDSLGRTTTYTVETSGGRRVVAVVWAEEVRAWVRQTIPQHLAKVAHTGLSVARRAGWARLTREPALSFVASTRDGTGMRFDDVHVVVSLFAETRPRRIRELIPGGYLQWVDDVFAKAGAPLGEIDIAHWIVCSTKAAKTVHLAYLPEDRRQTLLLPWELLSRAEKRNGSKLG